MTSVRSEPPVEGRHEPSPREREERLADEYCSFRAAGHPMLEALALATRSAVDGSDAAQRPPQA